MISIIIFIITLSWKKLSHLNMEVGKKFRVVEISIIQGIKLFQQKLICTRTNFAQFLTRIVVTKGRYSTDAFIARLSAWSFESPNILLAKNETISCESMPRFVNPVLKIVKHFISDSCFSIHSGMQQKSMVNGVFMKKI
jgi:hypothetical protein